MRKLPKGCSRFGADMGRRSTIPTVPTVMKLQQLQWVDGDYDEGGAYWGGPTRKGTEYIWWAYAEDGDAEVFVRAKDRATAKAAVLKDAPLAIVADDPELNMGEMLDAYIACALWITNDESTPSGGVPLDSKYGPEKVTKAARSKMRAECAKFLQENAADIGDNLSQAGHDLWLTRNGHGVGFDDGGRGYSNEAGKRLAEAARKLGDSYVYAQRGWVYCE